MNSVSGVQRGRMMDKLKNHMLGVVLGGLALMIIIVLVAAFAVQKIAIG